MLQAVDITNKHLRQELGTDKLSSSTEMNGIHYSVKQQLLYYSKGQWFETYVDVWRSLLQQHIIPATQKPYRESQYSDSLPKSKNAHEYFVNYRHYFDRTGHISSNNGNKTVTHNIQQTVVSILNI
jgi:hypothetical protein